MTVCGGEHEHDLMGSKKRAVNLTLRSLFFRGH